MADIVFEFGAAGGDLLSEIKNIREELVKTKDVVAGAKKEMQETFQQSAKHASEFDSELGKALKTVMEQKALIEQMTKKMMELENAQKGAYDTGGATKYVQKVKELENEIETLKKKHREVGEESKKATTVATQTMTTFLGVLDAAKAKLAGIKEGTAEYNRLAKEIKAAEVAQLKMVIAVDEQGNAAGGSRAELRAYRETLIELKKEGLDTTDMYRDLKRAAGELDDTIKDVNDEFRAVGSDTAGLDRLVRGVQLGTNVLGTFEGVMALTGQRNEEFEKTLIKLNGLMIVSNSLQQVMEELKRKDNVLTGVQIALQKTYATVVGTSTGAMKAFRIALAATGVGLLVLGIAALITKLKELSETTSETQKRNAAITEKSTEAYIEQKVQMDDLTARAKKHGKTKQEEEAILKDYNETFGDSIGKAKSYKEAEKLIIDQGPAFIEMTKLKAEEMAAFELRVENAKKAMIAQASSALDFANSLDKAQAWIGDKLGAGGWVTSATRRGEANRQEVISDSKKTEDALAAIQKDRHDRALAIQSKFNWDVKEKQKEGGKSQVDEQKKINERIIQLQRELAAARVEAMTEGMEKELAQERNNYDNKVDELIGQKVGASAGEITRINTLIDRTTQQHFANMLAIQTKYFDDASKAYSDAQAAIDEIRLSDQQKELDSVERHYDEIAEKIREAKKAAEDYNINPTGGLIDTSAFDEQQKTITEKRLKEINAINLKYGMQKLDNEEELAIAMNDLLENSGLEAEELEKVKEVSRLNIVIEYAKKRLAILEATGDEEHKVTIAKLKKLIKDSEKEIEVITKKEGDFTLGKWISKMIGLEEEDAKRAAASISNLIAGITEAQKLAAQKEIDLIDKKIAKIQEEVDVRTDAMEREKDLMEDGYANNYKIEEQKLAEAKARLDAETKNREEAQKNYESIQKREAAIRSASIAGQTIEQAVNLGTAATKIFSAHSGIPFVGVVLALAAVAAMVAGFFAIKNSIKAATTRAEKGRRVASGNRHSSGGNKYQSIDGNDPEILEIEEGEWVVNRKSSEKYDPLIAAINNDDLEGMPRPKLLRLLKPMGIHLDEDIPKRILNRYDESRGITKVVVINDKDDSAQWEKQNAILEKIASKEEKTVEYFNGYRIEKEGSRVRKIYNIKRDDTE